MLSELYLKTKQEVSNIENINFSEEEWVWFWEDVVKKRLSDLNSAEGWIMESYVHTSRAKSLLKSSKEKLSQCV